MAYACPNNCHHRMARLGTAGSRMHGCFQCGIVVCVSDRPLSLPPIFEFPVFGCECPADRLRDVLLPSAPSRPADIQSVSWSTFG